MNRGAGGLRRLYAVAAFLCLFSAALWAQTTPPSSDNDLDNLFNDNGTTGGTGAAQPGPGPQAAPGPAVRADDLTLDRSIHYFGSLDVYGQLGLGWSDWPYPNDLSNGLGWEGSGSFTASLGFEVRPAPELRIRATISYNWPSPGPQVSELITDYSVRQAVFFRLGIYNYTWGNSQFFQFSNLPSRSLPGWGVSNEPLWQRNNLIAVPPLIPPPVSLKMSIPIGLDNLTFLMRLDTENYGFPNPTTPDPKDAGYGVQFTMVTGPIEWALAGFWQHLLTPRSSLSMKTSVLGFDLSAETTMAFPWDFTPNSVLPIAAVGGGIYVGGTLQRIYPTAVIALSREWTDAHVKVTTEYAFNGERDAGISWLADETGPGGHNTVLALRVANMASSGITLNALWQHCWSDGSGLISPLLEVSPVPLTTLEFGPVFLYGDDGSETANNRQVPGSKRLELLLLVKVSDSYRQ